MSMTGLFTQAVSSLVRRFRGGQAQQPQGVSRARRGASSEARRSLVETLEERVQMSAAAPAGALLPDLMPWVSKGKSYVHGWSLDRSEKPGRTLLRLTSAIANVGQGPLELRGGPVKPTGQEVTQRLYNKDGTTTDRLAGAFTYHPQHHHTHFDDFASYRLRQYKEGGGVGKVVRSGKKVSFCLTDSDEFNTKLPNASEQGNYYACSSKKQGISVGWADVYGQSLPDQWIDITNLKAGRYWLEIAVDPSNRVLEGNENNNVARIRIKLEEQIPPKNDKFEDRTVLNGTPASAGGSNANASAELGEPEHETIGGASVWYSWTAPSDGNFTITTAGSDIDTLLTVYKGTVLKKLSRVAGNDDDKTSRTSKVTIKATAGTTYQIAIDGYRGQTGSYKLNVFKTP